MLSKAQNVTLVCVAAILGACGGGSAGEDALPGKQITYPISGMLTFLGVPLGQAAPSVTLVDNSPNSTRRLSIIAPGPFNFASVPTNTSYRLDVSPTPSGYRCEVINGVGTVTTSSVTDIQVTCAADALPPTLISSGTLPANDATNVIRTVRPTINFSTLLDPSTVTVGSITMLSSTGTQSTVVNVSGNQITVTSTRKLLPRVAYTLNVSTSVRGANGESLAVPVTISFTTEDGQWQAPVVIEAENAGDAINPQIAFDSQGNAMAIWTQANSTSSFIQANRFVATNSAWNTTTMPLSTPIDLYSDLKPQIAIHSNGDAQAVWQRAGGLRGFFLALGCNSFATTSGAWVPPVFCPSGDAVNPLVPTPTNPQIAVSTSGHALAVWEQADSTHIRVRSNNYTATAASGTWGAADTTIDDGNMAATKPQIAVDSSGNALAVWQQSNGAQTNIRSNRYSAAITGGEWESSTRLVSDSLGNASDPRIVIDANGRALAVWQQSDGTRTNIISNRYSSTAISDAWGSVTAVESDNAGDASFPWIAMNANGTAVAVWQQSNGTRTNIRSSRYTPIVTNGQWEMAIPMLSDGAGDASTPKVAIDNAGNATAVWQQHDGTRYNIWSNRYIANQSGGVWGAPSLVETNNAGDALQPQIAVASSGDALAVWQQYDGTRISIWSARFE